MDEPWNPDFVAHVSKNIYRNWTCTEAWKVIPVPALVAALDAIRTRILDFVLEIKKVSPSAGEGHSNSSSLPQATISQIFNTNIYGKNHNVVAGSTNVRQKTINNPNNGQLFTDLLNALHKSNEDEKIVSELRDIIEVMKSTQGDDSFSNHYKNFMSTLANHIQVLGPIVGPFLPALKAMIS